MNRFATVTLTFAVTLLAVYAIADEKPNDQEAMARMMKNLARYGMPDEHHAKLKTLAGTFDTKGTFQMAPGAPTMTTVGTHTREWVLDGRFLLEKSEALMDGRPFSGLGMIGHDRFKNKYSFMWADSMTTSVSLSYGQGDDKTFTYHATYDDPFTGGQMKHRNVLTIVDENTQTLEFFNMLPDKTEFKTGKLTFTRKQ